MKTATKIHPVYVKAKAGDWISHADIAKLIRTALSKAFPEVTFSVNTKTYSGGGSVSVRWTDGPSEKAVEAVAGQFETRGFDGSIDLAQDSDHWLAPDGSASCAYDGGTQGSMGYAPEIIGSAHHPDAVLVSRIAGSYVQCSQDLSQDRIRQGIAMVRGQNWVDLADFNWDGLGFDQWGNLTGTSSTRAYGGYLDALIYKAARSVGSLGGEL